MTMTRRDLIGAALSGAAVLAVPSVLRARLPSLDLQEGPHVHALKNPGCMCCDGWADHLRERGFTVTLEEHQDLASVKEALGVPEEVEGCHTGMVEGYLVEGHVPAEYVERMLREKPAIRGISVPGMPLGSPGMEGSDPSAYEPFDIVVFNLDGTTRVFATHDPRRG